MAALSRRFPEPGDGVGPGGQTHRAVRIGGGDRLGVLAKLVRDEARAERPAREVILEHLLQVLLIETLRSSAATQASPGQPPARYARETVLAPQSPQ